MELQRTPAQWFALLAGTFLTALGVLTLIFASVGFGGTGAEDRGDFLIWQATGWNAILWIAAGAIGLLMSTRVDAARTYGALAGAVFAVLAAWGWIEGGVETMGIFAIGTAGNIMHAILAVLGIGVAAMPESTQRAVTDTRPETSRDPRIGRI